MVNYGQIAVGSGLLLIVGAVLIVISNSIVIPAPYLTFLWIPYATNPEYALALVEKAGTMIFGLVFILGSPLYAIAKIASFGKSSIPPPPSSRITFCRYCGTQSKNDAVFCSKCGKRIAD